MNHTPKPEEGGRAISALSADKLRQEHYGQSGRLGYNSETGQHMCNVCGSLASADGPADQLGSVTYYCRRTTVSLGRSGL